MTLTTTVSLRLVLALLLMLLGTVPGTALAQEPIKIGTVFPLTGPNAVFGNQNFQGVDIAADLLNDRGGVGGRKIVLLKGDAPNPAAAISETTRLITRENLRILVGSTSSAVAIPATQEAEKSRAVYWEGMAVANDVTNRGFQYTFRVGLDAAGLGAPAMDYAARVVAPALKIAPKDLKVAIVAEDTSFGVQVSDAAIARAKEHGIEVVLREHYSAAKTTDMSPIILKLRSAAPDVVVATSFINDAILFARQSKELKFVPKAFIGTSAGHSTSALAKAIGDDTAGLFSSSYPPDINPAGLTDTARRDLEEFKRRYQAKYNQVPAVQEVVGFVTGMVLFRDVLPRAGSLEPDRIRAAVMELDLPAGSQINGWGVKFDAKGQNTRSFATVVQWQKQEMKVVYPQGLAVASPIMLPLPPWDRR